MKNLLLFAVAASLIQSTFADKLTTKRCVCASEHYIGYVSEWTVDGRSMGLPNDSNTFRRYETFIRDDNIFDQRAGYKCKPGGSITSENCVRIPDIFQYVSDQQMTPRYPSENCYERDGFNVCLSGSSIDRNAWIDMNGTAAELPRGQPYDKSIGDEDCQVQCRILWPTDNRISALCTVNYMVETHIENMNSWTNHFDRCYTSESAEWQWPVLVKQREWETSNRKLALDLLKYGWPLWGLLGFLMFFLVFVGLFDHAIVRITANILSIESGREDVSHGELTPVHQEGTSNWYEMV